MILLIRSEEMDTERRRWGQKGFGQNEDRMHLTVGYAHREGAFGRYLEGIEDRQEVGRGAEGAKMDWNVVVREGGVREKKERGGGRK